MRPRSLIHPGVRLARVVGYYTAVIAAKVATRPMSPKINLLLGQAAACAAVTRG